MKHEETITYSDIWYQVTYRWEDEDSHMDFVAYKIESMIEDKEGKETPAEISKDKCLEGYVKFDGCMNVKMQEGYSHFCGRYQTDQYGKLFDKIYDKAKEIGFDDN